MTSSSSAKTRPHGCDTLAAATRSLLGWGVVAGPFYLMVGLALGLTRPGFDLTKHSLSLLMPGAAFVYARWCRSRGEIHRSIFAATCGTVILVGFLGGAMLALSAVGVALLWLAVLSGWAWLAVAAGHLYVDEPHPVLSQRTGDAT